LLQNSGLQAVSRSRLAAASAKPAFEEKEFACCTEHEIRAFAFDVRKPISDGTGKAPGNLHPMPAAV
jgi:hypothetical protein